MRWKQHERNCKVCGNTYLFYPDTEETLAKIPDSVLVGNHPSRCPKCVDAPDQAPSEQDEIDAKVKADLDKIQADLDTKKKKGAKKAKWGVTPGGEKVKGYVSGKGGQGYEGDPVEHEEDKEKPFEPYYSPDKGGF